PLRRELVTLPFRNGEGVSTITREYWWSPYGPVIHRANGKVYVLKAAGDGVFRGGEKFLRMMRETSLDECRDAMRMQARMSSNFTYADRAGIILSVCICGLPLQPHPPGGYSVAIEVSRSEQIWSRLVPYDML